jgi:glycosyltransferase involved in cell wall biosynthesis
MYRGDPEIYRMFATTPEKQKLFMPMVPYELYPLMLSLWDIMLVPLLENHFNMAKSDIKLVEAGAKGIPYIASKMPVYEPWFKEVGNKAGMLSTNNEWYENIKYLVQNPEERMKMGKAGKAAAKTREMMELGKLWRAVIDQAIYDMKENYY